MQPGAVIASRFQVEALLGTGGLGPLYKGTDLESHKPVALRVLTGEIGNDDVLVERLRAQVRTASTVQHKNVASVFGLGKEGDVRFIAMEFIEGRSLRHLVEKKRSSRKTFSLKGAYNVVAHICNALTEAHKTMVHGLVGPGCVLINQVGRIKVCEFGMVPALPPGSNAVARLGDFYCIAPEAEQDPTSIGPRADIYSLGVMLFELLTGQPPPSPDVLPSQVAPHLGPGVDQVVSKCLQYDPRARFGETRELKAAFYAAMQDAEADQPTVDESGGVAVALAPGMHSGQAAPVQPRPAPAPPAASRPPARQAQPQPPARAPAHQPAAAPQQRPQQPPAAAAPMQVAPRPAAAQAAPAPAMQKPVDIQTLLADVGGDQTEKWLIQKDRLDFGPFSLGDLKQQLYKQEFSGDDVVVDQETGERNRIRNHPMLRDFIMQLERHLASEQANQAEMSRMQQEKRRRAWIIGIVAVSLAVLGASGAAAYYFLREPETRERIVYRERDNLGNMLKGIDITWKKEPEEQAKQRKKLRKRRRVVKKGPGGEDVTYLGDATKEGGDELLSQKKVQETMAQNFGRLKGCVVQAARRDPSLRQVVIDFGIRGTGRVASVKVNGKPAGPFQSCVYAKMQGIRFPSFDGQLTRASFSMNLQY